MNPMQTENSVLVLGEGENPVLAEENLQLECRFLVVQSHKASVPSFHL